MLIEDELLDVLLEVLVVIVVDVGVLVVVAVEEVVVGAGVGAIFKSGQPELSNSHLQPTKILKPIPISSLHLHRNKDLVAEVLLSIDIRMSTYQVCTSRYLHIALLRR